MSRKIIKFILLLILVMGCSYGCSGRKIDSILKHAEELKGTRKFDEALENYKLIISKYSEDKKAAIAYLKMGDLYFYTFNNIPDALASYTRVIEKWPFSEHAVESSLRRAEIYKSKKDLQAAIGEYEWVLKHFPDHKERDQVRLLLAEEYLDLNDPYQAAIELETLMKAEKLDKEIYAKALFDLGDSYFGMGDHERALRYFAEVERKFPDFSYLPEAKLHIVECLVRLNRVEEALALRRQLLKEYPDNELIKKEFEGLIRREEKTEKPSM